ncbi:MAG: peptidoglycan-binding domain-containing protein [Deltaproteobacteria bacterium]
MLKLDSRSDQVETIQKWLGELGFNPGPVDGIFGANTEKAVIRFQETANLYSDGVVGPTNMEAMEKAYTEHILEISSPGIDATDATEERYIFVRCEADEYEEGYRHLYLRQDAAEAYNEVLSKLRHFKGKLTSSGGKRSLQAQVNANRSATSFHYLGLAFDLYIWSGMEDPENDPYVIKIDDLTDRRFEVFVRCESEEVEEVEIDDVVRYHDPGLQNTVKVTGKFISLSKLLIDNGFQPIRARRRFIEDGIPLAAEWWHFQYEQPLIPYVSTFGGELLKLYSMQRLEGTLPWHFRNRIFKTNWV